MRIIYHHRTLSDGAEGIHIREMVLAFRQLGHEVKVIGPLGEMHETKDSNSKPSRLANLKALIPDLLFECFEIFYNFIGLLLLFKAHIRFHADLIYDRYITFNASSVLFGKIFRIPVAMEVNAPLAFERATEPDERLILRRFAQITESWICSNANRVFAVSTPLKKHLKKHGVRSEKVTVLPNAVNVDHFSDTNGMRTCLRESLGIRNRSVVIGFVGVLRPWHGVDILVKAFAHPAVRRTNAHLVIVGDGPSWPDLKALAASLDLESRIVFPGRVSHKEIPTYIKIFDIAVSPKATFYASPMKILEYMAQGKATVAPDMANICDIISQPDTGLLFEPDNIEDLVAKLLILIEDEMLRTQIGNRARKDVLTYRTWQRNAQTVTDMILYRDLDSSKRQICGVEG